ncbi:hypothetical protein EXIGLDRAFT_125958 [Exidia glandulosa HHB12029]|uniref:Uncharacterized protein n=1 Tax=Exidia glandulosa HHB12029 TaxID=1314781 RepID=A0A165GB10_EXIGL|nr:hypothetical protein EXIGLDRAFT_125958 [Exidia glandulosa HHB12029]
MGAQQDLSHSQSSSPSSQESYNELDQMQADMEDFIADLEMEEAEAANNSQSSSSFATSTQSERQTQTQASGQSQGKKAKEDFFKMKGLDSRYLCSLWEHEYAEIAFTYA